MRRVRWLLICVALLGISQSVDAQPRLDDPLASLEAESLRLMSTLESAQAAKARVQSDAAGLGASREGASEHLRKHARALYRITRAGMLPLAGGVQGMLSHLSRVDRLRRIVEHDAAALAAVETRAQGIGAELALAHRDIENAQRAIAALELRKQQVAAEQQASQQATVAFAAAFAGTSDGASFGSIAPALEGTFRTHDEAIEGDGFSAQHGRLPAPVLGAAVVEDASAGAVVFRAGRTGLVRAVAEGRVLVAEDRAPYGRIVIIDHGERYVTVYAGLGELDVSTGELVSRGARLGTLGEIDGSSGVRFEVRRGSERLFAREWLAR